MSIEEKPFFKAERIGKQHSSVISRPVKVVLDSSISFTDLLRKSKELKTTIFKNIYLTPDRTLEQREEHRTGSRIEGESLRNAKRTSFYQEWHSLQSSKISRR